MNFEEAMSALDGGQRVKLPEWVGYWFKKDGKILVMDRKGDVLETPYLEDFKNRTDWEITNGKRDFGGALIALKAGKLVARTGWNGKNMFIFQRPEDNIDIEVVRNNIKSLPEAVKNYYKQYGTGETQYADGSPIQVNFTAYLCMKAADNTIVNGWLASQTDMLAEDWEIID